MKRLFLAILVFAFIKANTFSQCTFSVSPGLTFNSANFGYKINSKFVAYIGFQFANVGIINETTGKEYDLMLHNIVDYSHKKELSGSLYIPNIGAKYYIKEVNKLKSYLTLNISKPIIGGKEKYDGKESESFKNDIKNVSMWGGEFGFGTEYFFDENFSVGGEFGLRYFRFGNSSEIDYLLYDSSTGIGTKSKIKNDYSVNLSPTYAKFSFNYYF